ncbi:hypothetical protein BDV96DRAFT_690875 [Lophiotrema nucula]|uniref:Uncharacterized protein n=1 Tax=Lophiotrema nucula TaxID=690887 RepID=A0A6A5YWQ6_9PLEO|nr:hypothetical protein BDV96DRAFT_690875 [Lophiotrema nucula]
MASQPLRPHPHSAPENRSAEASDTASDASSLSDMDEGQLLELFPEAGNRGDENVKMRKAQRIADLINLNLKPDGNRIEPEAVFNILDRFQNDDVTFVLKAIHDLAFVNFESAAIAIMKDPDVYIHVMAHEDTSGSDDDSEDGQHHIVNDFSSNIEGDDDDDDQWQSREQRDQSRKLLKEDMKKLGVHPSGHEPQEHETIEPHPTKPGRWIIKFRRDLPNGDVYEQEDLLPERNMLAEPPAPVPKADREERKGHPNYLVLPLDPSIPKFSATENSPWKKDGKLGYKRYSKKHKGWMRCTPKLILRKFEIGTNRYVEQFRWGTTWDIFDDDEHAGKFDINKKIHWQELNKWIVIIRAAWDSTYTKREPRKTWTKEEMIALYGYFNNLIRTKGLVVTAREWKATDAANAINAAMQAIDPNTPNRSVDATHAMAERDTRETWDPDRGIKDWILIGKELGQWLEEGMADNKHYRIPDSVNKPAAALNTATVEGSLSGAAQTQRNKKRMLELGLDPAVVISVKSKSKRAKAADKPRPSGKFQFTYLNSDVVYVIPKDTPSPAAENEKVGAEESAEESDKPSEEKDGRSPKRQRVK